MEKRWNRRKRSLAALLSVVMLVTAIPTIPVAAEETYTQVEAYNLEQTKEDILNSEDAKQYENGAVTFQGTAVAVPVGNELTYHLFRQGNTEKEQTATLVTQDLTAGYGDDYELVVDGEVLDGKKNILMNGTGTTYDVYLDGSAISESEEDLENTSAVSQDVDMDQVKENASCTFTLTFAPEEQMKEIHIRAKKPKKAVGDKQFQLFVLEGSDGLELGTNPVVAVTVQETRETDEASVSLVDDSEEVVDGYVTVLVERTGNTNGYTQYSLTAQDGSAVNGEDFLLNSSQLIFSPGVSRQRIHIPLIAADGKEKTFTLRTEDSKSEVTYTASSVSAAKTTFQSTRGLIDIPMTEFQTGDKTNAVDGITFNWEEDEERYKFGFRSVIGGGSQRNASIRTKQRYDFTGIESVRFSASYGVGTIAGDHLNVYASNEDYATQESMFGNKIGGRYSISDLTGQHLLEFDVDKKGEYFLFMTAEQHSGTGWIYYYLYNQEFNGKEEGHVALVMKPYNLEVLSPSSIGGTVPAGDAMLTMATDSSISGRNISGVYRDETFNFSYTLLNEHARFAGYELLNDQGEAYVKIESEVPVFTLSSDIINQYSDKFAENDTIRIRPIFKFDKAEVHIQEQEFTGSGTSSLNSHVDEENCKAIFTDNDEMIATVTWNTNTYDMGTTLMFEVEENPDYNGDYHFTAIEEVSASDANAVRSNPIYHFDDDWEKEISKAYYEFTPLISNRKSRLLLNVKGATHGTVEGEKEGNTEDEIVIEDFDGHYDENDIVIMLAKPDDGYRAKWSYNDVESGETKVYYGSVFYYQVQVAMLSTDNYVYLEFEKCDTKKKYSVVADVNMQGGNLMHEPTKDDVDYSPLSGAQVSLEGNSKTTGDDGCTDAYELYALPGETYTALVDANNRKYIEDVVVPTDGTTSIKQTMQLSYYYEGPRVSSLQYYDYDGVVQNGDAIYITEEKPSVIVAAQVETAGKEITDVIFRLRDKNGDIVSEEAVAERYGTEYIWSENLKMKASEGDQITIELAYREYDNGKENPPTKYISYGEVNTGYSIVIAEYNDIQYFPDTGVDDEYSCPIFGTLSTILGTYAKLTVTASKSGGITYITIGLTPSGYSYNPLADKGERHGLYNSWGSYKKGLDKAQEALSLLASKDTRYQAKQKLQKKNLSLYLTVSAQLALYEMVNEETHQKELECVGAFISFSLNGIFTYNYPILIEFVPCFVCLTISGSLSDSVEVYARDDDGCVPIQNMHDPTKSSYKSENDFNFAFNVSVCVGIGINGLADLAAGGTGKLALDWVDWSWGTGKVSFQIDVKLDFLIVGGTASVNIANFEVFNTNPYTQSTAQALEEATQDNFMNKKLSEFTMKSLDSYDQTVETGIQGSLKATNNTSQTLVSDAYEFSRPKMYPMADNKYLVVATVDSQFVNTSEKDTEGGKHAVIACAVYNANKNAFEKGEDGNIFHSLEPDHLIGDSINYHPSVTKIGSKGKYLITWNSVITDDTDALNLYNVRTVMKAAVYDTETHKVDVYKSMVSEDENQKLLSNVVLDTAYDEENDEVVVLYRAMNLNGLKEDSTLGDYSDVGSSLMCTSIPLDDEEKTFTDGVEIASGGKQDDTCKIIKTADLEIMDGHPVVAYQLTEGSQANIISTAEEGSKNHIYVTNLKHKNGDGYEVDSEKEVTKDTSEKYNATPQLLSYTSEEGEKNILMWKTQEGMATINPITFEDTEIAAISKDVAGVLGDYQIIQGEDGKIYSVWTEGTEDGLGTKVMMAALETIEGEDQNGDPMETILWGSGSEMFRTSNKEYIRAIEPVVDKDGNFHALYRKSLLNSDSKKNGYSEVVMQHKELDKNALTVENYSMLTDEDLEKYAEVPNLELSISNRYVKAGETVTLTGRVKNSGVQASEEQELTLLADGKDTGKTVTIPSMASGAEKEFNFSYTFPDDFDGTPVEFSVRGANGTEISETTIQGPCLNILSTSYKQLEYADDASSVSYDVSLFIQNIGNDISNEGKFVLSHLESGKDENGEDTIHDTVFGSCDIPEIKPGETERVTFRVEDIPIEYFQDNVFKLASIGGAIYENYDDEEKRNMISYFTDYIQAEEAPEAESITVAEKKKIGVGQSLHLTTAVYPTTAQRYAELSYQSSDPGIATVDENGIITGVKEGTCTITVTTKNGLEKTMKVQVTKEEASGDDEEYNENDKPGDDIGGNGSDWANGVDRTDTVNQKNQSKTGDANPIAMLILVLIVSGAAIVVIVRRKRKS